MKKISVITPTYNDEKSLRETLLSLVNQSYENWESIIIDDGSIDNTKNIIEDFKKEYDKHNKISYYYQENKDQLNAIINGLNYIKGDYIYVLHSDDLLPYDDFFKDIINIMEKSDCDALIGDLKIINENSNEVNYWKALKYINSKKTPVKVLLNNGENIYGDVALWKKEIYLTIIKQNYLTWNTPFWLDLQGKPKILNVNNVNFPILKYRIHEMNYINNEIGKFNVLNGELRTLTILLKYYYIPAYGIQKLFWKICRMRGVRRLGLSAYFSPIYFNRETKNKYKIIKSKIISSFGNGYKDNIFLRALLNFYNIDSNRTISLNNLNINEIYYGKDIRFFTKRMYENTIPEIYLKLFEEMNIGFKYISVKNEEEKEAAINLCKFLCIYPHVEVLINK